MKKQISVHEAASKVKSGMCVMVGGFLCSGSPLAIIDAILAGDADDLTIICSDAGMPDRGVGKLVSTGRVKRLIVSHIGTNPVAGQKMNAGEIEIELVPQGTLAERIRAGGFGLGGVLTPVGIGTQVEQGKSRLAIDGKLFLLEKPLHADVALIAGSMADDYGNVVYRGSSRNFNPIMAPSADLVIVQVDCICETLDPDVVHTPGLFVDYVVTGDTNHE